MSRACLQPRDLPSGPAASSESIPSPSTRLHGEQGWATARNVIEKVPLHCRSLGVDHVWFNPFFPHRARDNGCDISDYRAVTPPWAPWRTSTARRRARGEGIGVIPGWGPPATHLHRPQWFPARLAGDLLGHYIPAPRPKEDREPATNWVSKFSGPAWEAAGDTDHYYLHLFDHAPRLTSTGTAAVPFPGHKDRQLLARSGGARSFRFDVINLIGRTRSCVTPRAPFDRASMCTDPLVHDLRELAAFSASGPTRPVSPSEGEMSGTIPNLRGLLAPREPRASMVFQLPTTSKVDYDQGHKWTDIPPPTCPPSSGSSSDGPGHAGGQVERPVLEQPRPAQALTFR